MSREVSHVLRIPLHPATKAREASGCAVHLRHLLVPSPLDTRPRPWDASHTHEIATRLHTYVAHEPWKVPNSRALLPSIPFITACEAREALCYIVLPQNPFACSARGTRDLRMRPTPA